MIVFGFTNIQSPVSTAREVFKICLSMYEFIWFRNILIFVTVTEVIPCSSIYIYLNLLDAPCVPSLLCRTNGCHCSSHNPSPVPILFYNTKLSCPVFILVCWRWWQEVLKNFSTYLTNYMVLHPRRLSSYHLLLWKPQISNINVWVGKYHFCISEHKRLRLNSVILFMCCNCVLCRFMTIWSVRRNVLTHTVLTDTFSVQMHCHRY